MGDEIFCRAIGNTLILSNCWGKTEKKKVEVKWSYLKTNADWKSSYSLLRRCRASELGTDGGKFNIVNMHEN
jgi:hypothetical protein